MNKLYYFDINSRVYELNGIKKSSPYHIGYFVPIEIVEETAKEIICRYGGKINKKSKLYSYGGTKWKVYTEQEMLDEVYVAENRHLIAEKMRSVSADTLRQVQAILDQKQTA